MARVGARGLLGAEIRPLNFTAEQNSGGDETSGGGGGGHGKKGLAGKLPVKQSGNK